MALVLGLAWAALVAALAGSWTLWFTIPIALGVARWRHRKDPPVDRGPRRFMGAVREKLVNRDGGRCRYCGLAVHHGLECPNAPLGCGECCHIDHVLAWNEGGATVEANGVTSCRSCNLAKGKQPVEEFVAWLWSPEGMAWVEKRRANLEARGRPNGVRSR